MRKIEYRFEPKIVRVDNDSALKEFLSEEKRRGALQLSALLRDQYKKEYGTDLKISEKSLAAEIYDHYLLMRMTECAGRIFSPKLRPVRWMKRHMDVIDCGEKDVDNNRFLWDLFSLLWRKR